VTNSKLRSQDSQLISGSLWTFDMSLHSILVPARKKGKKESKISAQKKTRTFSSLSSLWDLYLALDTLFSGLNFWRPVSIHYFFSLELYELHLGFLKTMWNAQIVLDARRNFQLPRPVAIGFVPNIALTSLVIQVHALPKTT
jgi:hypothetical protein